MLFFLPSHHLPASHIFPAPTLRPHFPILSKLSRFYLRITEKWNIIIPFILQSQQKQMQTLATKDKKIIKNRKRSSRSSAEIHASKMGCFDVKQQIMQVQEETREQSRNWLEMTNIQLFLASSIANARHYPSSFALIKPAPCSLPQHVALEHLLHPNFPVLSYKIKDLIHFLSIILSTNQHAQQVLPTPDLTSLLTLIAQHYHSVSYHNFSHAFNLMLVNYQCIEREPALKKLYTEEEIFYIIIAAISHDIGHNGTNNQFQVKQGSELARASNNQAVLEHMHIRTLWMILQENPAVNFMMGAGNQQKARHIITRLILNTDMVYHAPRLQELQSLKNSNSLILTPQSDHKWLVMEQIFHACDIGNPCLDYDIYMSWAALLTYEFDQQARIEEKMGLQVTRSFVFKNMNSLYSDQEWFLGTIVQPLWKEISDIFPHLSIYHHNIQLNLKKIKEQTRTGYQE